ncbi:hypothetical protein BDP67DRAFT_532395 [Colletotrichum lupini]|nr:hypothetical protein BDP67DRAFT_532395 [Colletotrichum lupini]
MCLGISTIIRAWRERGLDKNEDIKENQDLYDLGKKIVSREPSAAEEMRMPCVPDSGSENIDGDTRDEGLVDTDWETITSDSDTGDWETINSDSNTDDGAYTCKITGQNTIYSTSGVEVLTPDLPSRIYSWEVKLIANLRQSRFIALPDEILLQIMHESELSDLYMLRQVSWTFWRLYQDRTFNKLHSSNISSSPSGLTMDESVVRAAKEQAFCQACRTSRESADFRKRLSKLDDSLFCSYCARDHPRLQFSSLRRQSLGHQRFCRLSEGSIQLCAHTSVPLVNLERDLHLATLDWLRSGGRKNLPSPRGWCLEECSVCKEIGEGLLIQKMKPPSIRGEIRTFNTNRGAKSLIRFCTVSWKFPVMPVSDDQPFDDIILETKFKELQGRFGRLLCPHRTFKQLMEPLDPDSELNILEGRPSPPLGVRSAFSWAFSRSQSRDSRIAARGPWYARSSSSHNGRAHSTQCPICHARFDWSLEGGSIHLTRSGGEFTPKVNEVYGWKDEPYGLNGILASELTSYEVVSDSEAKHILWCDRKDYRNGGDMNYYSRQLQKYRV